MIDPRLYVDLMRVVFPPATDVSVLGFLNHRLSTTVRSALFSPKAVLLQMRALGSIRRMTYRNVEYWSESLGDINHDVSTDEGYLKVYDRAAEPQADPRQLRAFFHSMGVRRPVVHSILVKRGEFEMLWNYTHLHKNNTYGFDRLVNIMQAIDETVIERYVFDLYAVSQAGIPLRFTEPKLALWLAHNEKFIADCIEPLVYEAHGRPIPVVRRSWLPSPYVISDVIPINELTSERAMEPSVPRPPPADMGFDASMESDKDDKKDNSKHSS